MHYPRRHFAGTALLISATIVLGCGNARRAPRVEHAGPPVRGGILKIVGGNDVDHLAATSSYAMHSTWLLRTFVRQLVSYPSSYDWRTATQIAPDLAETVPTVQNGGITEGGRTYTFHLRRGVFWDTAPPREVNAHDVVRGMKLLCNPVSPTGAPGYYDTTILGMRDYCDGFARVPSTAADIKNFVETHDIQGVRATDDFTVVFRLPQPAPDFLNLLAMLFPSPAPTEYLQYLPDSPEFRQHTISNGPYRIAKYVPNHEYRLERNPAWNPATDPLRPAYVDGVEIRLGMDAELVQLQLEAGTADLSFDQYPSGAELATLLEVDDPNLTLAPPDQDFAEFVYLVINLAGPNGALRNSNVRKALAWAVDKMALVQNRGGPLAASPARQAVMRGVTGFLDGADSFVTPGDRGDPERAREILAEAGYRQGLKLKLAYAVFIEFFLGAQSL